MLKYDLENIDIHFGESKFTLLCDEEKSCTRLNENIFLGHHMPQIFVHVETHLQSRPLVITSKINRLRKKLCDFAGLVLKWILLITRQPNRASWKICKRTHIFKQI